MLFGLSQRPINKFCSTSSASLRTLRPNKFPLTHLSLSHRKRAVASPLVSIIVRLEVKIKKSSEAICARQERVYSVKCELS